jgi:hypothetical protein
MGLLAIPFPLHREPETGWRRLESGMESARERARVKMTSKRMAVMEPPFIRLEPGRVKG